MRKQKGEGEGEGRGGKEGGGRWRRESRSSGV